MAEARVDAAAFNAFEAAGWEKHAAGYHDFFRPIIARLVEPLLDAADVGPGTRVLDAGCGPGYVSAKAAERGAVTLGVDNAEAMIAIARQSCPSLEFQRGDVEALAFPDQSFDSVVGNLIMLHVGRPELAAAEFARILVPNGRLALTVWDFAERARVFGVFLDAVAAAGAVAPEEIPVGPSFFRFSDEQEFRRLLSDHGLEDIEVGTISFSHCEPSADALWTGLIGGTVRTSALILGETAETQRKIHVAFDRIVQDYRVGDRLELPVSVKLASGRKPAAS
jgi:ubiquinone/menaquinone biosynthesis C-methylase UbiE